MNVNKINARYFSKGTQLELYKHFYLDLLPPEKILGTILNRAESLSGGYGYGRGYYYYGNYGKY